MTKLVEIVFILLIYILRAILSMALGWLFYLTVCLPFIDYNM